MQKEMKPQDPKEMCDIRVIPNVRAFMHGVAAIYKGKKSGNVWLIYTDGSKEGICWPELDLSSADEREWEIIETVQRVARESESVPV